MHRLGFLAKLAFIGNLFFVLCVVLQRQEGTQQTTLISLVAILGLVIGMGIANPVSNLLNGLALIRKRPLFASVPKWLFASNLFFLFLQVIYILHTWS